MKCYNLQNKVQEAYYIVLFLFLNSLYFLLQDFILGISCLEIQSSHLVNNLISRRSILQRALGDKNQAIIGGTRGQVYTHRAFLWEPRVSSLQSQLYARGSNVETLRNIPVSCLFDSSRYKIHIFFKLNLLLLDLRSGEVNSQTIIAQGRIWELLDGCDLGIFN